MKQKDAVRVGRALLKAKSEQVAKELARAPKKELAPKFTLKSFGTAQGEISQTNYPTNKELVESNIRERLTNFGQRGLTPEKTKNEAEAFELTKSIVTNIKKIAGDGEGRPVGWSADDDAATEWDNDELSDSPNRTIAEDDSGQGDVSGIIGSPEQPDSTINDDSDNQQVSSDESETDTYGTDPAHSAVDASSDNTVESAVDSVFDDADLLLALSRAIRERKNVLKQTAPKPAEVPGQPSYLEEDRGTQADWEKHGGKPFPQAAAPFKETKVKKEEAGEVHSSHADWAPHGGKPFPEAAPPFKDEQPQARKPGTEHSAFPGSMAQFAEPPKMPKSDEDVKVVENPTQGMTHSDYLSNKSVTKRAIHGPGVTHDKFHSCVEQVSQDPSVDNPHAVCMSSLQTKELTPDVLEEFRKCAKCSPILKMIGSSQEVSKEEGGPGSGRRPSGQTHDERTQDLENRGYKEVTTTVGGGDADSVHGDPKTGAGVYTHSEYNPDSQQYEVRQTSQISPAEMASRFKFRRQ
jgi:hypothetical protein